MEEVKEVRGEKVHGKMGEREPAPEVAGVEGEVCDDQAPQPIAFVVGIVNGMVGMRFERPVNEIMMTPSQARMFADHLKQKAAQAKPGLSKKRRRRRGK